MFKYQKYINALFFLAAAAMWLISHHYVIMAIGYFQLARKIGGGSTEVIQHTLPLLLAIATFAFLRNNSTTYNFTSDAVGELVKVSWPTQKEVRIGTIVVVITVIMAGIILGLIDLGYTSLVRSIIGA